MTEDRLTEIENEVIELFVRVNSDFGNDDVTARIVSLIYLSPSEISMDDLISRTGYSAATICNKIKMLVNIGLVKKLSRPGTKKVFLHTDKDMGKIMCDAFRKIIEIKVKPIKENLPRLIDEYKKEAKHKKAGEESAKKLEIIENHLKSTVLIEKHINEMIKNMGCNQ